MHYNLIFWIIIAIILVEFAWSQVRAALNRSCMSDVLPPELEGIYDAQEYARQQQYQRANGRMALLERSASTILLLVVLFAGVLGWLEALLQQVTSHHVLLPVLFVAIISVITTIASLPFDYYDTFVIEERFGFNTSTPKLFFMDTLKNLFISLILISMIVGVVAFLYYLTPQWFWIWAWGALTLFSIGMGYFYSQLIVPLFNKQTPLKEGDLRDALFALAEKTGFAIQEVYLIDGSKRSTKANAYFTGFGKRKRICLYDTLIDELETEEIVAVLAHEIGHYKRYHILIGMGIGVLQNGFQLWLISLFLRSPALALALGSRNGATPSFILGLIAVILLYGPLSEILSVGGNALSRKNEYQADAYAAHCGLTKPLISGLKKISAKALANMTPHPVVVFWTYSHPPLLQRIAKLNEQANSYASES